MEVYLVVAAISFVIMIVPVLEMKSAGVAEGLPPSMIVYVVFIPLIWPLTFFFIISTAIGIVHRAFISREDVADGSTAPAVQPPAATPAFRSERRGVSLGDYLRSQLDTADKDPRS